MYSKNFLKTRVVNPKGSTTQEMLHLYKHDKQTNNDRKEGNTFNERC